MATTAVRGYRGHDSRQARAFFRRFRPQRLGPPITKLAQRQLAPGQSLAELVQTDWLPIMAPATNNVDQAVIDDLLTLAPRHRLSGEEQRVFAALITAQDVRDALRRCHRSKAAGPDCLPNDLYRNHAHELEPILTKVYQACWSSGSVPRTFQEAIVTALPKTPSPASSLDFRPIAELNTDYKVYARVLANHVLRVQATKTVRLRLHPDGRADDPVFPVKPLPTVSRMLGINVVLRRSITAEWDQLELRIMRRLMVASLKTTDPLQRIRLVNAIAMPIIRYVARHVWPKARHIRSMQCLLDGFVWSGQFKPAVRRRAWVAAPVAQLPLADGGLQYPSVLQQLKAMATSVIFRGYSKPPSSRPPGIAFHPSTPLLLSSSSIKTCRLRSTLVDTGLGVASAMLPPLEPAHGSATLLAELHRHEKCISWHGRTLVVDARHELPLIHAMASQQEETVGHLNLELLEDVPVTILDRPNTHQSLGNLLHIRRRARGVLSCRIRRRARVRKTTVQAAILRLVALAPAILLVDPLGHTPTYRTASGRTWRGSHPSNGSILQLFDRPKCPRRKFQACLSWIQRRQRAPATRRQQRAKASLQTLPNHLRKPLYQWNWRRINALPGTTSADRGLLFRLSQGYLRFYHPESGSACPHVDCGGHS